VLAGVIEDPAAPVDAVRFAAAFRDLPAPASLVERLAVERQFEIFAEQAAARLHRRIHGHAPDVPCAYSRLHQPFRVDPAQAFGPLRLEAAFGMWLSTIINALRITRPRGVGARARRRLDERKITQAARDLAAEFGCSPSLLRRRFAEESGESLVRYRSRTRIVAAIRLLTTTDLKIEAIAREVGWMSKKDLYAHVKRATGLTPGDVRQSSADTIAMLLASLGARGMTPESPDTTLHPS